MPTKYDVFAEIIERAPCKVVELPFTTHVYAHINALEKEKWVKKSKQGIVPVKNNITIEAFKIIKYCLKNGLDYNKFFSKNIAKVIIEISKSVPNLRPNSLQNNKDNVDLMKYLEANQFMLVTKKKSRTGILLAHQLLDSVLKYNTLNNKLSTSKYLNIFEQVTKIKSQEINPFDNEVFSFLSGSAQLEGSTVTVGETRDLIINDIYPDKPKKDIQMVKNLNEALHYILEHLSEEITPEHVREVNRAVLFSLHRNAGKYKTTHNKIQGNPDFKTALASKVPELMINYCKQLKEFDEKLLNNLGYVHNELQHIHPFSDGNSRTTRMILNWMMLKQKLPIVVLKMGCFDEYMSLTKFSKKRDDGKLTKLFHHLLLHEELMK